MIATKWSGAVKMLLKIQEYCVSRKDCIKPNECPFMGSFIVCFLQSLLNGNLMTGRRKRLGKPTGCRCQNCRRRNEREKKP